MLSVIDKIVFNDYKTICVCLTHLCILSKAACAPMLDTSLCSIDVAPDNYLCLHSSKFKINLILNLQ